MAAFAVGVVSRSRCLSLRSVTIGTQVTREQREGQSRCRLRARLLQSAKGRVIALELHRKPTTGEAQQAVHFVTFAGKMAGEMRSDESGNSGGLNGSTQH